MIETTLAIVAIIIIFIYIHPDYQPSPPGPWNFPILGYLHKLDNLTFTQLAQKYGPICSLKLGFGNVVVISEGTLLRKVLKRHEGLDRPPLQIFNTIFQNKGLTYSPRDLWKNHRKFVNKFLNAACATKDTSKTYEEQISQSAEEFVQDVQSRGDRATFDPSEAVKHYVIDIMQTVFLGTFRRDDNLVKLLTCNFDKLIKQTTFSDQPNCLPFVNLLSKYREAMKSVQELMTTTHQIIGELISRDVKSTTDSSTNLIDAFLLETSKCNSDEIYSIEQLQHLLCDMFGAGFITTSTSILWNLLYLAQYQDVQNKVRQELSDVLQGKAPHINDLRKLPYSQATIAEVARIRTLLPLGFPHYTSDDARFKVYTIRKSTTIVPLLWTIHMDSKVWKMPENFCPDRFLNDKGEFYQPESFLPYQAGEKMCLGKDMADMMISLFVGTVLQKFKIEGLKTCSVDLSYEWGLVTIPKSQELVFVKV